MDNDLVLYGSGDAGTKELLSALQRKRVKHRFLDVRDPWDDFANLRAVHNQHRTMPQLYRADGSHIGGYEAASSHIATLPYAHQALLSA